MLDKSIVSTKGSKLRKSIKTKVKRHGNKRVRAAGKKSIKAD